jgi:DNA-binding PadR family transcriptional regulator
VDAARYVRFAMSLKHAVLALIVERRGYGYELVQRFEERIGPGWRLNPSAVYPALDQLERGGLATASARRGGTHRSPRVVYAPTAAGAAALDAWLSSPGTPPEPIRSELHLRIAFARAEHDGALAAQLAAHEGACRELLGRYPRQHGATAGWRATLVDDAVRARLEAELAWLASARGAVGDETS